jgi:hypothetical protein
MNRASILERVVISAFLLLLFTGCGNSRSASPSVVAYPAGVNTPSSSPVGFNVAGLFYIESYPVNCVFDGFSARFVSSNLILTNTHPNNYDSSELQQMEKYIKALIDHSSKEPPLPATLHWSQGGSVCGASLDITNISQNTVQIQSINMQVTSVPKGNTSHYDLIDACSLLSASERVSCPGLFGGAPSLEYSYVLKKSSIGTLFSPQTPGPIVLKPNDIAYVSLDFRPIGTSTNLIYHIMPELMLQKGTVELKSANMELVFASKDQFSCAQLSKNTFVPEFPIPAPFSPDGQLSGHWCM